ncbi:MAG: hypothetical protein RR336_03565 [Oscillospiraceae bacterium]
MPNLSADKIPPAMPVKYGSKVGENEKILEKLQEIANSNGSLTQVKRFVIALLCRMEMLKVWEQVFFKLHL